MTKGPARGPFSPVTSCYFEEALPAEIGGALRESPTLARRFPVRSRGRTSTSWYLHCPNSKSPTPDHLLSADSTHHSGSVRTDCRSASTASRTKHSATWSLTTPHACIAA